MFGGTIELRVGASQYESSRVITNRRESKEMILLWRRWKMTRSSKKSWPCLKVPNYVHFPRRKVKPDVFLSRCCGFTKHASASLIFDSYLLSAEATVSSVAHVWAVISLSTRSRAVWKLIESDWGVGKTAFDHFLLLLRWAQTLPTPVTPVSESIKM